MQAPLLLVVVVVVPVVVLPVDVVELVVLVDAVVAVVELLAVELSSPPHPASKAVEPTLASQPSACRRPRICLAMIVRS
jgi:hypothetical protein